MKVTPQEKTILDAALEVVARETISRTRMHLIAEEAGMSQSNLHYHFKTKDDLLSYYIEEQPTIDPDCLELPENAAEAKRAIILVYLNYVSYCKELGVAFISNYYTPKNQALNPAIRTKRPYPIVTVTDYLARALEAGTVSASLSLDEISTDIRMIVIGNVFEWCLRDGNTDFDGNMERSLGKYLDSVLK